MHGMDNITLSPETYEIELRRRPIVSTSQLKLQAGLAQTQFATAASKRNVPWVKRFTSAMSALCRLSLRLRKYRCTTTNVERGQWPTSRPIQMLLQADRYDRVTKNRRASSLHKSDRWSARALDWAFFGVMQGHTVISSERDAS
jgi:hypothetical protein